MAYLNCIRDSGRSKFACLATSGLCITVLLTSIVMSSGIAATSVQVPADSDRAASAVKLLRSPDENERQAAKQELIQIGSLAIPPLLSLLEEMSRNPNKFYFATGKEEEGEEALRLWDDGVIKDFPPNLSISWRLRNDVYELLGCLRAVEAVPLLVQIMEKQDSPITGSVYKEEMRPLVAIGPPAVPALIESMEMAKERTPTKGFGDPQPTPEEKERLIKEEAAMIRAKVAIVLGKIGDARALPVLEKFLEQSDELGSRRADIQFIEEAIRQIKKKNSQQAPRIGSSAPQQPR